MSSFYIPKYNCVFIHIPKTAGSSIRNGFFNGQCIGAYYRYPYKYKHLFSFCFVRNPYDRIISAYNFLHKKKLETTKYKNFQLSFDDFIEIVIDKSIDHVYCNIYENIYSFIRHHTIPQTHIFNQLHNAKFVGRYENLDNDWQYICEQINAEYKPLPNNNVSKTLNWYNKLYQQWFPDKFRIKYYKKYLNQHNLSVINTFFSQDFSVLNYEKIQDLG